MSLFVLVLDSHPLSRMCNLSRDDLLQALRAEFLNDRDSDSPLYAFDAAHHTVSTLRQLSLFDSSELGLTRAWIL